MTASLTNANVRVLLRNIDVENESLLPKSQKSLPAVLLFCLFSPPPHFAAALLQSYGAITGVPLPAALGQVRSDCLTKKRRSSKTNDHDPVIFELS